MTEVFENLCPYCMAIGMSYEEYWYGESNLVSYYKNAFDYKRKMRNEELWIQGMYNLKAVSVALNNAFKGHDKYFEKPLDIYPKTLVEKEEEKRKERKKIIEYFSLLKQRWDNGNTR